MNAIERGREREKKQERKHKYWLFVRKTAKQHCIRCTHLILFGLLHFGMFMFHSKEAFFLLGALRFAAFVYIIIFIDSRVAFQSFLLFCMKIGSRYLLIVHFAMFISSHSFTIYYWICRRFVGVAIIVQLHLNECVFVAVLRCVKIAYWKQFNCCVCFQFHPHNYSVKWISINCVLYKYRTQRIELNSNSNWHGNCGEAVVAENRVAVDELCDWATP